MSNEPTATIPVENLSVLREKLEKLNRKAEKLGLDVDPITLREGERREVQHEGEDWTEQVVDVYVEGASPKLNGWRFVATLEHDEGGVIIRRLPTFGEDIDLTQYRDASPENCDHCGYKRRRNDTYIVAQTDGRTAQVGSTCLKDFIGHASPQQIAKWLESLRDTLEQSGDRGQRIQKRYYLDAVLEVAAAEIYHHGYVSRRNAEETGRNATAEVVSNEFFARMHKLNPEPLDVGNIDVAKVTEWVRALDEKELENDYLYNLFTVCRNATITSRQFGIAASAITAYQRAEERRIQRETRNATRVDEFLAEPKTKVDVTFIVEQIFSFAGDYGMSYKHVLRTDSGHAMVWSTGQEPLTLGKKYSATFSVKEQLDSKYGKQIKVWRPKNLEEIA